MEMLTGPVGLGVGGTILAVVLIYFALPYLPLGDSTDVKNYKKLQQAVMAVKLKRNDDNVRPEHFKPLVDDMNKIAKEVLNDIKDGKSAGQRKLRTLAKSIQEMAKGEVVKLSDAEKTVDKNLTSTAKELKVKN